MGWIDCYHYFGASETYFPDVFSKLVKPGGQFGFVVPGLTKEFEKGYPETLAQLWLPVLFTFYSGKWWRALWKKTGLCEIVSCYDIDEPKAIWRHWANWAKVNFDKEFGETEGGGHFDEKFLNADINNDIALIALTARKKSRTS